MKQRSLEATRELFFVKGRKEKNLKYPVQQIPDRILNYTHLKIKYDSSKQVRACILPEFLHILAQTLQLYSIYFFMRFI